MIRRLLFLFILVYPAKVKSFESLVSNAMKDIIDQIASENNREFHIVNFGDKNGEGERVIGKLLKLENFSIAIKNVKDSRKNPELKSFEIYDTNFMVFDSVDNFNKVIPKLFFTKPPSGFPLHFIFIPKFTMELLERFSSRVSRSMDEFYFFVDETEQSIDLVTSWYITPEACYKNQWKIFNRFKRKKMRWNQQIFFEDKYRNFFGWPVRVQPHEGKYETELFSIFAKHFNFTPEKIELKGRFLFDNYFTLNRGITSALGANIERMTFMHFEQSKIFIPPGELYGDYEKMLLPFDNLTWIGIVLTIFGGVVVIVLIKWLSPSNQELFFGRNNRSPIVNFISIILNGSQNDSLAENLPRMLLMLFIIWCLIFR
jgi:hypothetical protein